MRKGKTTRKSGPRQDRTQQKASINRGGLSDLIDYAAILDQHWDGLAGERAGSGSELRYISREELEDAMVAAALAAIADFNPVVGPLISANDRLKMQVTHLLCQPDLRMRHPSLDIDLLVADVEFTGEGVVVVWFVTIEEEPQRFRFTLSEMHVAGPVNDAVRTMVQGMAGAVVGDAIARMIEHGKLKPLPDLALDYPTKFAAEFLGEPVSEHAEASEAFFAESVDRCWKCGRPLVEGLCPWISIGEAPECDPLSSPGEDTVVAHGERRAEEPQSETVHHGQAIRSEWRCVGCKTVVEAIVEPDRCEECGGRTFAGVHHLQPHPSYVLKDGEFHAEPVKDEHCPNCGASFTNCVC